ncbi:hypothetical protein CRG98_029502 [Punica granatum]|uniref:Uncharacterized protein n=1 Tax=Punica granatum TaxID=22663 RepID=A0A2I0J322_PUNGR|nr:hypothetical protein CRG98_029502 [Punica granatum]
MCQSWAHLIRFLAYIDNSTFNSNHELRMRDQLRPELSSDFSSSTVGPTGCPRAAVPCPKIFGLISFALLPLLAQNIKKKLKTTLQLLINALGSSSSRTLGSHLSSSSLRWPTFANGATNGQIGDFGTLPFSRVNSAPTARPDARRHPPARARARALSVDACSSPRACPLVTARACTRAPMRPDVSPCACMHACAQHVHDVPCARLSAHVHAPDHASEHPPALVHASARPVACLSLPEHVSLCTRTSFQAFNQVTRLSNPSLTLSSHPEASMSGNVWIDSRNTIPTRSKQTGSRVCLKKRWPRLSLSLSG